MIYDGEAEKHMQDQAIKIKELTQERDGLRAEVKRLDKPHPKLVEVLHKHEKPEDCNCDALTIQAGAWARIKRLESELANLKAEIESTHEVGQMHCADAVKLSSRLSLMQELLNESTGLMKILNRKEAHEVVDEYLDKVKALSSVAVEKCECHLPGFKKHNNKCDLCKSKPSGAVEQKPYQEPCTCISFSLVECMSCMARRILKPSVAGEEQHGK